jgi:hypothetical protein
MRSLIHHPSSPHSRNLPWEQQPATTPTVVVPRKVKTRNTSAALQAVHAATRLSTM